MDAWRIAFLAVALAPGSLAHAQSPAPPPDDRPTFEIYGHAMLDLGHDFTQIDPKWFDTMRVTRLPSFENQFGRDHNTFAGVRQSLFGVRSSTPTALGPLHTTFAFDLFGTGVDAGQTTFRLQRAYGEVGAFGAGHISSPFMDPDVFPTSLEFWGPTGMVAFPNVQFRFMPIRGDTSLTIALERPGASGDAGVVADRIELQNIKPRFPVPDVTAAYRVARKWGYVRAASALRLLKYDDLLDDQFDLSGGVTGWGVNLSSNVNAGKKDVIRAQFVFGEGIQNYMNDSPIDVGVVRDTSSNVRPVRGEAIPIVGMVLFLEHTWNAKFGSTVGYSRQDNDNTAGQAPNAFRTGQYALGNIRYYPVTNVMVGGELQWGRRENFSDGFHSDGVKLQFSFKYDFSYKLAGS